MQHVGDNVGFRNQITGWECPLMGPSRLSDIIISICKKEVDKYSKIIFYYFLLFCHVVYFLQKSFTFTVQSHYIKQKQQPAFELSLVISIAVLRETMLKK